MKQHKIKNWIKIGSVAIFALIIVGYSFFKTRDLLYGTQIKIEGIESGAVFYKPLVDFKGQMKNSVLLTINDSLVFINQEGVFDEPILLHPGYNLVTVKSEDKFGKKMEKKYELMYNALSNFSPE